LVLVVFDLLYLDGRDLREFPLSERRQKLRELVGDASSALQFSEELSGTAYRSTVPLTAWV